MVEDKIYPFEIIDTIGCNYSIFKLLKQLEFTLSTLLKT